VASSAKLYLFCATCLEGIFQYLKKIGGTNISELQILRVKKVQGFFWTIGGPKSSEKILIKYHKGELH